MFLRHSKRCFLRYGEKTFEIRFNDRNFKVGQELKLRKTRYTGAEMAKGCPLIYVDECLDVPYFERAPIFCKVTYILEGPCYGLAEGWVIMSIEVLRGVGA